MENLHRDYDVYYNIDFKIISDFFDSIKQNLKFDNAKKLFGLFGKIL